MRAEGNEYSGGEWFFKNVPASSLFKGQLCKK